MAVLIALYLVSLLAIRSFILAIAESKSWYSRLLDGFLFLLFGSLACFLFLFGELKAPDHTGIVLGSFLIAGVLVALSLAFRLRRQSGRSTALMLLKTIFVLLVLCFSLIAVMITGFLSLTEDRPIMKLTMTGNFRQQFVEWQSPESVSRKETLRVYEVVFDHPDGKPLTTLYVYGDQVAVKAKVIRLQPVLNAIGIGNLCRIEYVYNGYLTMERFNYYPHLAQEIPSTYPKVREVQDRFWNYWEQFYFQESKSGLVKSATLESTYFPLVRSDLSPFRGSYYLTIHQGGLSGVPVP